MTTKYPARIISGGQTGADRAALDYAICSGITHGGWCPRGRRSQDGRIPDRYQLTETDVRDYSVRTEKNVLDSSGTLLFQMVLSGGTRLTREFCRRHCKPCLTIDVDEARENLAGTAAKIGQWLLEERIEVLNVAGHREEMCPGIADLVFNALTLTRNYLYPIQ